MSEHEWVRHTIDEVRIVRVQIPGILKLIPLFEALDGWWAVRFPGGARNRVVGCDNCALPLSEALLEEPCLALLQEELEESAGEDLTS